MRRYIEMAFQVLVIGVIVVVAVFLIVQSRVDKLERCSNERVTRVMDELVGKIEAEEVKCQTEKGKVPTQPAPAAQVNPQQTSEERVVEMMLPKTTIRYRIPAPDMLIEQQQDKEEVAVMPPDPPPPVVAEPVTQRFTVSPKIKVIQCSAPEIIYSDSPDNQGEVR